MIELNLLNQDYKFFQGKVQLILTEDNYLFYFYQQILFNAYKSDFDIIKISIKDDKDIQQKIAKNLATHSLFGKANLFFVDINSFKFNKKDIQELNNIESQIQNSQSILFLYAPFIRKNHQKDQWYQNIASAKLIYKIIAPTHLANWIKHQSQLMNITLTLNQIETVAEKYNGNYYEIIQFFLKIQCLSIQNEEKIDALIYEDSQLQINDYINYVFTGNIKGALKTLLRLSGDKQNLTILLFYLVNHFNKLKQVKNLQNQSLNEKQIFLKLAIWFNDQTVFRKNARIFSLSDIDKILYKCSQIDQSLKGIIKLNAIHPLCQITKQISFRLK